jgi:hypothetical protein
MEFPAVSSAFFKAKQYLPLPVMRFLPLTLLSASGRALLSSSYGCHHPLWRNLVKQGVGWVTAIQAFCPAGFDKDVSFR